MTSIQSVNGTRNSANQGLESVLPSNNSTTTTAPIPAEDLMGTTGFLFRRGPNGTWIPVVEGGNAPAVTPSTPPSTPTTPPAEPSRQTSEERLISNVSRELQTRTASLRQAETEYEAAKRALDNTPQSQGGGGCFGGGASTNPAWTTAKATLDRATTALEAARREYRSTVQLLDRAIDLVPVGAGGGASSTEQMIRRRDELMNGVNAAVTAETQAEQALAEARAQPDFGGWAGFFGKPNWQETVNRAQAALDAARAATLQASTLLTGYINADVRTTTATATS